MSKTKFVSRAVRKKDSQALVTGKPVYTGDLVPPGALTVKLLRSPMPGPGSRRSTAPLPGRFRG